MTRIRELLSKWNTMINWMSKMGPPYRSPYCTLQYSGKEDYVFIIYRYFFIKKIKPPESQNSCKNCFFFNFLKKNFNFFLIFFLNFLEFFFGNFSWIFWKKKFLFEIFFVIFLKFFSLFFEIFYIFLEFNNF